MMKKGFAALFVVVLMAALAPETAAVVCDPTALATCTAAIVFGTTPTEGCCSSLKAQEPCFCQYITNPTYGIYVSSPNAKTAAAYCRIVIPTAC